MNHLDIDIKKASWLNDNQKDKLIKVYNSVKAKDVDELGFEALGFYGKDNRADIKEPWEYKRAMIAAIRLLSLVDASKVVSDDLIKIGGLFQNIYEFFDHFDDTDFSKLMDVYEVYNYSTGDLDNQIDQLMEKHDIDRS